MLIGSQSCSPRILSRIGVWTLTFCFRTMTLLFWSHSCAVLASCFGASSCWKANLLLSCRCRIHQLFLLNFPHASFSPDIIWHLLIVLFSSTTSYSPWLTKRWSFQGFVYAAIIGNPLTTHTHKLSVYLLLYALKPNDRSSDSISVYFDIKESFLLLSGQNKTTRLEEWHKPNFVATFWEMCSIIIHLTTHVDHVLGVYKELKLKLCYGRSFDLHMNQLNRHKR